MIRPTQIRLLALLAGVLDSSTGVALMVLPSATLHLMLVPEPPHEAIVYVRFLGAFVASVGSLYLWGLGRGTDRLRLVLTATLLPRGIVGGFVLTAVATGSLSLSWLSVTATDWGLVVLQVWLLQSRAR